MIALARVISRRFDGRRVYGNCLRSIKSVFSYFPSTWRWLARSVLLTKTLLPRAFETDCSSSIGGLTPPKDYKRRAWSRIDRQYTTAPFYCRGAEKTCSFAQGAQKKNIHIGLSHLVHCWRFLKGCDAWRVSFSIRDE